MAGVQLKVRLSVELVARVDAVRGPASRPAWVAWLVERELGAVGGGRVSGLPAEAGLSPGQERAASFRRATQ